jgi:hypothetical protein
LRLEYKLVLLIGGSIVVIALAWFGSFLYSYLACQPHMTRCLPESVFIEPVTQTPEAKAFLGKYPDAKFYVDQTCLEDRGYPCSVDIVHNQNSSFPEGARVRLETQVNVTSFSNPDPSIGEKRLSCVSWVANKELIGIGQLNSWTVRGDMIQNLQPDTPDCWDTGPPAPPSDNELIQKAKNTAVANAYFADYPDNTITVKRDGTDSRVPEVTFIPTTSEPIKMIVHFIGLDWDIGWTSIACSNGNQTWYLLDDDSDFWSRFQPEQGNCWDYPPLE